MKQLQITPQITFDEKADSMIFKTGWLAGWLAGRLLAGWLLAGWPAGWWLAAGWLAGCWLGGWPLRFVAQNAKNNIRAPEY